MKFVIDSNISPRIYNTIEFYDTKTFCEKLTYTDIDNYINKLFDNNKRFSAPKILNYGEIILTETDHNPDILLMDTYISIFDEKTQCETIIKICDFSITDTTFGVYRAFVKIYGTGATTII